MRAPAVFAAAVLSTAACAQFQRSTQDVWFLDQAAASIKTLNSGVDATIVQTIALAGSGQPRSMAFDAAGLAFVCRGDEVRTYDGTTTALFAGTAVGVVAAQDVAVRPTNGDVYVACGVNAAASKILRFDSTGVLQATLTSTLIDHPRRLAWSSDGATLYIGSTGNRRILSYTPSTNAFAQVIDLTSLNVSPVGLAYDVTRVGLWVTGDWWLAGGGVGFVALPPATIAYTGILTTTTTPGLSAPGNLFYDRFRNLYVAGRGQNSGTAGVYVYSAPSGAAPVLELSRTGLGIQDVIDVRLRPDVVGFTAPLDPGDPTKFILEASSSVSKTNALQFRCPSAAGKTYFAGLSVAWPADCAPYVPGVLDSSLLVAGPDPRGVPAKYDFLFRATAGVCCFGSPPLFTLPTDPVVSPFLSVSGFAGVLNASGESPGAVKFSAGIPTSADGLQLSISFVVVDGSVVSQFGRISDAFCATLKVAP
jgi:hypothetical protein